MKATTLYMECKGALKNKSVAGMKITTSSLANATNWLFESARQNRYFSSY
ncbi:hypothetical protein QQ008_15520 [Fulvivirgaceae bacterium BMA10]|uniref:Uncharacterized protein n=1 Tax=Splendidivirga corallicola TaxID=3051826 RepID=A0ABT8KQT9_9BACT|nr:hypothetical protein [Fulvivirgaceae bacterium BMA10]